MSCANALYTQYNMCLWGGNVSLSVNNLCTGNELQINRVWRSKHI
jgi:hypothetical protein